MQETHASRTCVFELSVASHVPRVPIPVGNSMLQPHAGARHRASLRDRRGCGRHAAPDGSPARRASTAQRRGPTTRSLPLPVSPPHRVAPPPLPHLSGYRASPLHSAVLAWHGRPPLAAGLRRYPPPEAVERDPQAVRHQLRCGGRCDPIADPIVGPGTVRRSAVPEHRPVRLGDRNGTDSSLRSTGTAPGKLDDPGRGRW